MKGQEEHQMIKNILFIIIIAVVLVLFALVISGKSMDLTKAIAANLRVIFPVFS